MKTSKLLLTAALALSVSFGASAAEWTAGPGDAADTIDVQYGNDTNTAFHINSKTGAVTDYDGNSIGQAAYIDGEMQLDINGETYNVNVDGDGIMNPSSSASFEQAQNEVLHDSISYEDALDMGLDYQNAAIDYSNRQDEEQNEIITDNSEAIDKINESIDNGDFKGDTGAAGDKGDKGDKGDTGAAGKDGQDADMSLVDANTDLINQNKADQADKDHSQDNSINENSNQIVTNKAEQEAINEGLNDAISGNTDLINSNKAEQAVTDGKQNDAIDGNTDLINSNKAEQLVTDTKQDDAIAGNTDLINSNKAEQAVTDNKQDDAITGNTDLIASNKAEQAITDSKQNTAISANTQNIAENERNIFANRKDINLLFAEVNRLDDKIDGVMASTHAINNARPYLRSSGQTAVGVGMGYAGDSGAVAIGAAHSFNNNWSTSMTLNITTGSNSEVSGGAGVHYVF